MIGTGFSSSGFTPGGFGEPTAPPERSQQEWVIQGTNISGTGRYINPETRDYEFDSNGLFRGDTSAQQMVFLALATTRASAADLNMGQNLFKLRTIGGNYIQFITNLINEALAELVNNGVIIVNNIEVKRNNTNRLTTFITWTDASTQEQHIQTI